MAVRGVDSSEGGSVFDLRLKGAERREVNELRRELREVRAEAAGSSGGGAARKLMPAGQWREGSWSDGCQRVEGHGGAKSKCW